MSSLIKFISVVFIVGATTQNLSAQQYTYDTFNRLTSVTYPDGSEILYTYDDLGNRVGYEVIVVRVCLNIKMLLSGPFDNASGLMRDDLRTLGVIPTTEPYTDMVNFVHRGGGAEVVSDAATVFADYGSESIVDWVFVELRDATDPTVVVGTRSALLQRDGDVVDVDGVSPLCFGSLEAGDYYVAVRHRNHLGTMTADAISISSTGSVIDFTNSELDLWANQVQFEGLEQAQIGGLYGLWAGNTSGDGKVAYIGVANDVIPVFSEIAGAPENIFGSLSFVLTGYESADVNMDGKVIYSGIGNDIDGIFNRVDGHLANLFRSQAFIIREQLPD